MPCKPYSHNDYKLGYDVSERFGEADKERFAAERGTAFALHRNDGHRNAFDVVIARHVVAEFQAFVETFVLGDSTIQNDVILGIAHHEVA